MSSKIKKKPLLSEIQQISVLTSTFLILTVQIVSLIITSLILVSDLNKKAISIADELQTIFQEPLYNVDNVQTVRIGETLLSSGRISGIIIDSSATGIVFDRSIEGESLWIKSQTRKIYAKKFYVGEITIQFNDEQLIETVMQFLVLIISVIIAFLVVYFIVNKSFVQNRIGSTFSVIINGINEIAKGDYKNVIPMTNYSDIDSIIQMINNMAFNIDTKNKQLLDINSQLEQRVMERTIELKQSLDNLKQMQQRLIESGKLSALGQLSAGIAHELNTPLGAIKSAILISIGYQDDILNNCFHYLLTLDKNDMFLFNLIIDTGNVKTKFFNVQFTGRKELKAAITFLSENGIQEARNIGNTLADINLLDHLKEIVPAIKNADTEKVSEIISIAGEMLLIRRMSEIIKIALMKSETVMNALRSYLNPSDKGKAQVVNLADNITQVLTLMHNMLKHGINIKTEIEEVFIKASSDELSQIWMNLIRNAAQAMEFQGEIIIQMHKNQDQVYVHIIDHGCGIPHNIKDRIFDPFFTTKKAGEGMGLGLDITKRLIESWNGAISIESRPGYTEVIVNFPLYKPD